MNKEKIDYFNGRKRKRGKDLVYVEFFADDFMYVFADIDKGYLDKLSSEDIYYLFYNDIKRYFPNVKSFNILGVRIRSEKYKNKYISFVA